MNRPGTYPLSTVPDFQIPSVTSYLHLQQPDAHITAVLFRDVNTDVIGGCPYRNQSNVKWAVVRSTIIKKKRAFSIKHTQTKYPFV